MQKTLPKPPSRSSTAGLLLCLFCALVTLSYAIYYQSKATKTQSAPAIASPMIDGKTFGQSAAELSDEAFVTAALRWELDRIETQLRENEAAQLSPEFIEGRSFERYTSQLRADLEQIPEDQVGLRAPLLERLHEAKSDSGRE